MDSSLINLIPNLTARRGIPSPGSLARNTASESPPSTSVPRYSPPPGVKVPLRIRLTGSRSPRWPHRRPLLWANDESIRLGTYMTYEDFLITLEQKLSVKFATEPWDVEVVADFRGRTQWRFDKQVMIVGSETWELVIKGIDESLIKGLEVSCWPREEVAMKEG